MAVTVLALLLMANHIDADTFQHPESDPLDAMIDRLATCESGQVPDLRVWDVYSYSFGWLQFKKPTFDLFGEKYHLPHDDILSPEQQIPIAKKMLREPGGYRNWFNCSKRIGLTKLNINER